ncbi:MAG: hypothetical protein P4N60_23725 [Verrucomicrobiae bacterium]|nr:hypothetical protein [Verrucomicrobiae bacterium]
MNPFHLSFFRSAIMAAKIFPVAAVKIKCWKIRGVVECASRAAAAAALKRPQSKRSATLPTLQGRWASRAGGGKSGVALRLPPQSKISQVFDGLQPQAHIHCWQRGKCSPRSSNFQRRDWLDDLSSQNTEH